MPIAGGETVNFTFQTPTLAARSYTFTVSRATASTVAQGMKAKTYTLEVVSKEVQTHKTTNIQKSYQNKMHSDMVKDIFTSFLQSTKNFNVQATQGILNYWVTSQRPFEAIRNIALRSVSASDKSGSFLFFENKDGYHFRTMEDLIRQGTLSATQYTYTNDQTVKTSIGNKSFRNVIGFTIPQQYDAPNRLGGGGLGSQTQSLDFKTLEYKASNNSPKATDFLFAEAGALSSAIFTNQFAGKIGLTRYIPMDSGNPLTSIEKMIPQRDAYISNMAQTFLNMHIMGDSSLTAGNMVTANLIAPDSTTGNRTEEALVAGKFLITHLRHIISPSNVHPRYTCAVECIKGGYKTGVS